MKSPEQGACGDLAGAVHFDMREDGAKSLRLLIDGEEICRSGRSAVVNVAGLLVLAFLGPQGTSPEWAGAESARAVFAQRCAAFGEEPEGCIDALTATAHCGGHTDCIRGRSWMASHIGADAADAWRDALPPTAAVARPAGSRPAAALLAEHAAAADVATAAAPDTSVVQAVSDALGAASTASGEPGDEITDPLLARPPDGPAGYGTPAYFARTLEQHAWHVLGERTTSVPSDEFGNLTMPRQAMERGWKVRDPEHERMMRDHIERQRAMGVPTNYTDDDILYSYRPLPGRGPTPLTNAQREAMEAHGVKGEVLAERLWQPQPLGPDATLNDRRRAAAAASLAAELYPAVGTPTYPAVAAGTRAAATAEAGAAEAGGAEGAAEAGVAAVGAAEATAAGPPPPPPAAPLDAAVQAAEAAAARERLEAVRQQQLAAAASAHARAELAESRAAAAAAARCGGGAEVAASEAAAIDQSTAAMEDFLLKGRRASTVAPRALEALRGGLECSPTLAKAWYRYGFLIHRHAKLPHAAMAALKHTLILKPNSGPAYAELGVVALYLLANDTAVKEREMITLARKSLTVAMELHPRMALHALQGSFAKDYGGADGLVSMGDAVRLAVDRRQAKARDGASANEYGALGVVHRLRGATLEAVRMRVLHEERGGVPDVAPVAADSDAAATATAHDATDAANAASSIAANAAAYAAASAAPANADARAASTLDAAAAAIDAAAAATADSPIAPAAAADDADATALPPAAATVATAADTELAAASRPVPSAAAAMADAKAWWDTADADSEGVEVEGTEGTEGPEGTGCPEAPEGKGEGEGEGGAAVDVGDSKKESGKQRRRDAARARRRQEKQERRQEKQEKQERREERRQAAKTINDEFDAEHPPDVESVATYRSSDPLSAAASDDDAELLLGRLGGGAGLVCTQRGTGYWAYELCLNANASQYPYRSTDDPGTLSRTLLGTYTRTVRPGLGRADAAGALVQFYEHGARCENTRLRRALRVDYACGPRLQILSVEEPATCSYQMHVAHPHVCDELRRE